MCHLILIYEPHLPVKRVI